MIRPSQPGQVNLFKYHWRLRSSMSSTSRGMTLLRRILKRLRIQAFYLKHDYLEAYRRHTDDRVTRDPHLAIGGFWDEVGALQSSFLKSKGLSPQNTLLDIGCGTLRGGRHFIRYLAPGNYTGIDISPKAIEYGWQLVKEEGLTEKRPQLIVPSELGLTFSDLEGRKFDFLLAQSVFTHLLPDQVEQCFQNLHKVMSDTSRFFFTFYESPEKFKKRTKKDFSYPKSFFDDLARRHNLNLTLHSYAHPTGQKMLEVKRAATSAI
jgi:SAM-dependent methyltransferase